MSVRQRADDEPPAGYALISKSVASCVCPHLWVNGSGERYCCCRGDAVRPVDHPPHYGGASNPYEAIKVIDAWQLNFCLGNVVKYIARAGKKDPAKLAEDLEKARWYLDHEIARVKRGDTST